MSEQNKSWNNIPKKNKNKNKYNKKKTYSIDKSYIYNKCSKESKTILSKKDFPSLTKNKLSEDTSSFSVVWRKGKHNHAVNSTNIIYVKAKNGSNLLNLYPKLNDSPEPPLFQ